MKLIEWKIDRSQQCFTKKLYLHCLFNNDYIRTKGTHHSWGIFRLGPPHLRVYDHLSMNNPFCGSCDGVPMTWGASIPFFENLDLLFEFDFSFRFLASILGLFDDQLSFCCGANNSIAAFIPYPPKSHQRLIHRANLIIHQSKAQLWFPTDQWDAMVISTMLKIQKDSLLSFPHQVQFLIC